ncbi:YihY/virulence factor BrkB family protein [Devriesea agamarum]|uniref:YihY/virulence factor BrkB family protein n=1 Tax=Devriesea agamarum TaxID=472569 RepID=UPI000A038B25|nr:YihY/virulence factor BrkB family protein [Devriesea agamarum]
MSSRRPCPQVVLLQPRLSIFQVIGRSVRRLIDIQVWDVAGTMTFYFLLSLFPLGVALVSTVSVIGFEDEIVRTIVGLARDIFPTLHTDPLVEGMLALSRKGGGVPGLVIGTIAAFISASNGLAAFHRAMHRVYDTREGRPFIWFRVVVFVETVLLIASTATMTALLALSSQVARRLGEAVGIPRTAFDVWDIAKWPVLLVMLILAVSLAYHWFPNVRMPRYRVMSVGSIAAVLVLFLGALVFGRALTMMSAFSTVLPTLNVTIVLLVMVWVANIVLVAGAAFDAEILRARQLALGLPAWHYIQLPPRHSYSLRRLARDARHAEELSRVVHDAAASGMPATFRSTYALVEARSKLAVNPSPAVRARLDDARAHGRNLEEEIIPPDSVELPSPQPSTMHHERLAHFLSHYGVRIGHEPAPTDTPDSAARGQRDVHDADD